MSHFKEILNRTEFVPPEDGKALRQYADEMHTISYYLERDKGRIKETYKILERLKERFGKKSPAYIYDGIIDAMEELKK